MDGFTGFKTAAAEELPHAVPVMDPFHVMQAVIDTVTSGVPVLAFFDRPGTSNGPTEAINGRLEHLPGSALDFRNLTHYIARSPLEAGGSRPALHPRLRRAGKVRAAAEAHE
jgi:transposase